MALNRVVYRDRRVLGLFQVGYMAAGGNPDQLILRDRRLEFCRICRPQNAIAIAPKNQRRLGNVRDFIRQEVISTAFRECN